MPQLFISYSHSDKYWFDELQKGLQPLFDGAELTIWSDQHIQPGEDWYEKIKDALNSSAAAILIVTPDFLDSKFIKKEELPKLTAMASQDRLKILWIHARPSVVEETAISRYQALHDPKYPLATKSEAQQGVEIVKICKKIKEIVSGQSGEELLHDSGSEHRELALVRKFNVQTDDLSVCHVEHDGRIWCTNGRQIQLYRLFQNALEDRWPLPKSQWKTEAFWRGNIIFSDWAGNLRRFYSRLSIQETPFYAAKEDDLPIHRLTVAADGRLLSAAWNGCIRVWEKPEQMLLSFKIPELPLHLAGLPNQLLVVADQERCLRFFDQTGQQIGAWEARGPIVGLWPCPHAGKPHVLAQVGRHELHLVQLGQEHSEATHFAQPIVGLSRQRADDAGGWTVVAQEDGRVDWVSDEPFQYDPTAGLRVDFSIRQIQMVVNPDAPASLLALGLTSGGELFSIEERHVTRFRTQTDFQRLQIEPTGRFLLLHHSEAIWVYRNPVLRQVLCRVRYVSSNGTLKQGKFTQLSIKFVNEGTVPICGLKAELDGLTPELMAPAQLQKEPRLPILPNEQFELQFSVKALEQGALPLRLQLKLTDEGGPPWQKITQDIEVESHGRA